MKRAALFFILALAFGQAFAVNKYVDSSCATPGNGTTSVCSGANAPYAAFSSWTPAANDTLNCTGTFPEQVSVTNVTGVSIVKYGAGCIIDGGNSRSYGVLADRTSSFVLDGVEIKNATLVGVKIFSNTASTTVTTVAVRNSIIHNIGPGTASPATETDLETGTCLLVRSGPTTGTAIINGVSIDNNKVYQCGKHGIDFRYRVLNVSVTGNEVYRAGLTATGHGISIHAFNQTSYSPGWTNASGFIYYRNRLSPNDVEQRMVNYTTGAIMTKVASSTTPAVGEWSVTSAGVGVCANAATEGCLYINTGANPATQTVVLKRHLHGPFTITGNKVHHNVSGVDTAEGHGIDADDLAGPFTIARNDVFSNANAGIQVFYGESGRVESNLSYGNAGSGLYIKACTTCAVIGNTLWGNGDLGLYDGGTTTVGLTAYNNILAYNKTRGGSVSGGTAGAAGFGSGSNLTFANVNNNSCISITCPSAFDPMVKGRTAPAVAEDFKLTPGSPVICLGDKTLGVLVDYKSRRHEPNCVSLGAYMYGAGDAAPVRSPAP